MSAETPRRSADEYRDAAREAARWLRGQASGDDVSLYSGAPGPILFLNALARSTGDAVALADARQRAEDLAAIVTTRTAVGAGLYDGLAGVGFTLGQFDATRPAALDCVARLRDSATAEGDGVEWSDSIDIIGGGAGIGLFLLWADSELHAPGARELATRAGRHLRPAVLSPAALQFPNFSHGTAGVAYFLATLYQRTREQPFLDAALDAARHLVAMADRTHDGCLVHHDEAPEGRHLYYLGWCHGPAGTARLFYGLYQATADDQWMEWTVRAARGLTARGAPGTIVTPGEWDNAGLCCGVAAQAQFFLDLHRATREPACLDLARAAGDVLLARATQDADGVRWVHAESRRTPDVRTASIGLMQGASGIAGTLLNLADTLDGRDRAPLALPDNPFRSDL